MSRIVLNTFGSFGDLHPFLALALELLRRGHHPVIATSEIYRSKVESEDIEFAAVRPDIGQLRDDEEFLAQLWHPRRGTEFLIRDYLAPRVEGSFEDLARASRGADLLITHSAALAGPTVAEAEKRPWLSVVLQPSLFLSAYDPPVVPETWIRHLYFLGRAARKVMFDLGRARVKSWTKPLLDLRKRLGLSTHASPLFEGAFSPFGTLALFSPHFAPPQPDWPETVTTTGFVFYDKLGPGLLSARMPEPGSLSAFLARGEPPIVFTLGSSAVMHPGSFYRESLAAALKLGRRAVLLTGALSEQALGPLPDSVFIAPYAPYSELFPCAAAVVHQGGIGTTAQALRAGKPMLVVPWAHDQPDNAQRTRNLGVARALDRGRYHRATAARELEALLSDPGYSTRAAALGAQIRGENGLANACHAIQSCLAMSS